MFPKPKPALTPNTYAYESEPLVKPTGFREYDARWLLGQEINLMVVEALRMALVAGLMAAGCKVHDIGLAVTPMAYFAQFDLDVPCVAMVTASHNDNGWT